MIAQINASKSFLSTANYNQKKVDNKEAQIIYSQKLYSTAPDKVAYVFETLNKSRTQNAVFHISLSFHEDDGLKLNDEKMIELSKVYLERMGYGRQPYIIYRHDDTAHPHVHILTSRVHIEQQKKIEHDFERFRSKKITTQIEREYGLVIANQQPKIKTELVAHIQSALQKSRPENIQQLNQTLEELELPVRARATKNGLIYHGIGKDGKRHSKSYRSSTYKEVGLDAPSLQAQFQQNTQTRQQLQAAINETLPPQGKTTIGLFSKGLQAKGITTDFKVNPDSSVSIHYGYKGYIYKDVNLNTTAQQQLVFPEPQDLRLREQLKQSIAANQPLELSYENGKLVVQSPNKELEQNLNKRSDREILAITDTHNKYREEYQRTDIPNVQNAVLALAASDIDDTLQEKINRERIDQRKIKR